MVFERFVRIQAPIQEIIHKHHNENVPFKSNVTFHSARPYARSPQIFVQWSRIYMPKYESDFVSHVRKKNPSYHQNIKHYKQQITSTSQLHS
ncbi:hypothetical protein CEXT_572681 [Caerostris extrusa]|uniref:Uncharacterized protein n=1 Tax=Caerostris extrusa TaxID=172846 RepID=A0AAV4Y701_CAEEX|nr:hypothetical protein CEXT_572681 [Caerostris extrusa]